MTGCYWQAEAEDTDRPHLEKSRLFHFRTEAEAESFAEKVRAGEVDPWA